MQNLALAPTECQRGFPDPMGQNAAEWTSRPSAGC